MYNNIQLAKMRQQALLEMSANLHNARRQRAHPAFRQVEFNLVLVGGLHPLHRELFDAHVRQYTF